MADDFVPRSEYDALEARRRALQADGDRARAERDKLARELEAAVARQSTPAPARTVDDASADVLAAIAREQERSEAAAQLQERYPFASQEALQARTIEEMSAGAERSHRAEAERQEHARQAAQESAFAEFSKAVLPPAPQAPLDAPLPEKLSAERFEAMGWSERMGVKKDDLERIAREVT